MTCKCGHPQHWHNGGIYHCTFCANASCTRPAHCYTLGHEPCHCTEYQESK